MAKDLGTITHEIKTSGGGGGGGTSNTDAGSGSGSGRGGGSDTNAMKGIGNTIRGFSSGGISGGAQAGAGAMGFAKLAGTIGLVAGAYTAQLMVMKKIIKTLFKWGAEIDKTVKRFAGLNAQMAYRSATMSINELRRDLKSADVLAGPMTTVSSRSDSLADAFRPLKNIGALLKTLLVGIAQPILGLLVYGITQIIKQLNGSNKLMSIIGNAIISMISIFAKIASLGTANQEIDMITSVFRAMMGGLFEELDDALTKILSELQRRNDDSKVNALNQYMGNVGVELTGGQWNPWRKP
jgi:hypothetical protein